MPEFLKGKSFYIAPSLAGATNRLSGPVASVVALGTSVPAIPVEPIAPRLNPPLFCIREGMTLPGEFPDFLYAVLLEKRIASGGK